MSQAPPRGRKRGRLARLGLLLAATLLSLGLAEVALRVAGFRFHLYPERLEFGYPDPEVFDDYFQPHDQYLWVQHEYDAHLARARQEPLDLVLMGCSCTEWGLFDKELQKRGRRRDPSFHLANLACSGWSSYMGLQQMRRDVVALRPKAVTIFFGWNDHWMGFGVEDKVAAELKPSGTSWREDLRLVQLLTKARVALASPEGAEGLGADARPARVSLEDYRANLTGMVRLAQEASITPVLITAPTNHRRGQEPEYLRERWIADLDQLVPLHQAYVEVTREVAQATGALLCDLARHFAEMSPEERDRCFKEDGIHFTKEGGPVVGEFLFRFLARHDLVPPRQAGAEDDDG